MQTIERKYESFDDLRFEIDLSEYGKTLTDVDDIIFSVKNTAIEADDVILEKKLSLSEIVASGTDVLDVSVIWLDTEYDNFTIGENYLAGLFVKFTGDPKADENVDTIFQLRIIQDFLRQ